MKNTIGLLLCFWAICPLKAQNAPQNAPDPLAPQAEELRLEGVIASVDWPSRRLSFAATRFSLPNGKSDVVKTLKPKTVLLPASTQLRVRGDDQTPLETKRIVPGLFAVIVGRDAGGGQPLTARVVAVWNKANGEKYSLSAPEKTNETETVEPQTVAPDENEARENAAKEAVAKEAVAKEAATKETPTRVAPTLPLEGEINHILSSNFENLGDDNRAEDWHYDNRQSVQFIENDDGHYVSLNTRDGERKISRTIMLDPNWKTLKVRARVRGSDLKQGKEIWANAHIGFEFRNDKNDVTGYGFPINLNRDSDWRTLSGAAPIPAGSTRATLDAGNFGAEGIFDVDDLVVYHDIAPDAPPLAPGFPEGRFETLDDDGLPRGWNLLNTAGITLVEENGNHFLHLTNPPPNRYIGVESPWLLKPGTKTIRISAKMRVHDLVKGKNGWETARLGLAFNKLNGEVAGDWPPSLELHQDTDWQTLSATLTVPPDAVFFKITPQFLVANGTMDVDDIQVEQLP